jgi:hypothetical protein
MFISKQDDAFEKKGYRTECSFCCRLRAICERLAVVIVFVAPENGLIALSGWTAENRSCHHMISGIDIRGGAGDISGEIADQPYGDRANILNGDEPPHRRPHASFVHQLVEVLDP